MEQPDAGGADQSEHIEEPTASQFALDDFDIDTSPAPLSEMMGLPDSVVTVRRRSTGDVRMYPDDPSWVAGMVTDLAEGRFGR